MSRRWDAVQEFCVAWEKNGDTGFRECCHEYRDLEEFENLFREHFRDFLARKLDRQIGLRKDLRRVRYLESSPFRGINFFDFEHAALYYGRTKAIWEVLDALKNQAAAKKAFVLVLGPTGSGKSSLVRARRNANLTGQSNALEIQLKEAEEQAQLAQQNTGLATSQRSALETELQKAQEEKAELTQQNANLTGQSSALETQLKKAEENAQLAQQNADLATSQRGALETELQKAQEEKAELTQQNANLTSQSSALEAQLKNVEEKAQLAQQNADLATSQRNALQIELEKTREEKAQLEQQNAELISVEPSTSETQVKAKGKGQRHANPATHKRKAQQSRLKKASSKATPKNRTKKRSGSATTR